MRTCDIAGCGRKHRGRGLCIPHLARLNRHGHTFPDRPIGRGLQGCAVEGCDRPHYAKDHCRAHYERLAGTGDVRASVPVAARRGGGSRPIDLDDPGDL